MLTIGKPPRLLVEAFLYLHLFFISNCKNIFGEYATPRKRQFSRLNLNSYLYFTISRIDTFYTRNPQISWFCKSVPILTMQILEYRDYCITICFLDIAFYTVTQYGVYQCLCFFRVFIAFFYNNHICISICC